jgi:hypothetical protein
MGIADQARGDVPGEQFGSQDELFGPRPLFVARAFFVVLWFHPHLHVLAAKPMVAVRLGE